MSGKKICKNCGEKYAMPNSDDCLSCYCNKRMELRKRKCRDNSEQERRAFIDGAAIATMKGSLANPDVYVDKLIGESSDYLAVRKFTEHCYKLALALWEQKQKVNP